MRAAKPAQANLDNLRLVSKRLKNLNHFLFFGTLLGYIRERTIIENDDDIDLYVDRAHRAEVQNQFAAEDGVKFRRRLAKFKTEFFSQAIRRFGDTKTYIDFYFFEDDPTRDVIIENWNFHGRFRNPSQALHIPKSLIYPLQTGTMHDFEVKLPADPKGCCAYLYGDNWRTPLSKSDGDYTTRIVDNRPEQILARRNGVQNDSE